MDPLIPFFNSIYSLNRRSKKRISTRAASSAASSSTNVVDNEIDQAMANTETTTSGATRYVFKKKIQLEQFLHKQKNLLNSTPSKIMQNSASIEPNFQISTVCKKQHNLEYSAKKLEENSCYSFINMINISATLLV